MKKTVILAPLFLAIPIVTMTLVRIAEPLGLLWLAIDTVYYAPMYYLWPELFEKAEIGLLIPSNYGRVFGFVVYAVLLLLTYWVIKTFSQK